MLYYSSAEALAQHSADWHLDQVRAKAAVSLATEGTLTLGVATGPAEFVTAQLQRKTQVAKAMHERVKLCHDPQTEFVLARDSLGVGRVNHILRVHGHSLLEQSDAAARFDAVGRATLERLFHGVTDEGHIQASLSDAEGGLRWRQAQDVARPAHLGSLVAVGPRVRTMIQTCVVAGLLPAASLERRLSAVVDAAETAYLASLDEVERVKAEDFLRRAKAAAEVAWGRIVHGTVGSEPAAPRIARDIGEGADDEVTEERGRARRINALQLQRELSILVDRTKVRRLIDTLRSQGAWSQVDRLAELRHKDVSHKWLRHLDAKSGSVLSAIDFVPNVQKRLGNRVSTCAVTCRLCGTLVDAHLEHSETCSTAEATRGHYACVHAMVEGLRLADPSVTTEPRGLTSTTSRPADILTTAAVPGRGAALDVCVASPNAAAALGDAAEAAFRRKLRRYRREIRELGTAGIAFRPLVWTADGRPHPAVMRTLRFAAEIAVTRNGQLATASSFVSRWKHEISIAILRRRAAMARAVLPRASAQELWLLAGQVDRAEGDDARLPPLDEDGGEDEEPQGSRSWADDDLLDHVLESDDDP